MRVLWFSNTPANADEYLDSELKGTGGWLKALNKELQNKIELHIAFYLNKSMAQFSYQETYYFPILKNKNIIQKALRVASNYVMDAKDLDKYIEIINQVDPDIIHIHGTENPFGCLLGNIEKPIVVSLQGIPTVISHKYLSGIEIRYLNVKAKSKFSIKSLVLPSPFKSAWIKMNKMQKLEAKNLEICKHILGRTIWDKRVSRVLAPNSTYHHIDEILRESFYKNKWRNRRNGKIILFTTNSNNFYKGFETLCLALYELNKLKINCEWRVAGISPDDLIVRVVKKKIKNKYPEANLVLFGRLTEKELVENLLLADIYVMPSHIENSPNNLCEAMILGMPCIATFAGGTGTLLKDGYEGILIQDGDPWAMAGAVLELVEDVDKAQYFGENARARAIERHNKEKIVSEILKVYQMLNKVELMNEIP